jgi:hypothetical protein
MESTKKCTKCGKIKMFGEFTKSKKGKYGLRADCKECHNQSQKESIERRKQKNPNYFSDRYNKRKEKNPNLNKEQYQLALLRGIDNNAKNKKFMERNPDYRKKGNPGYRSYTERKDYIGKWLSHPINTLKHNLRGLTNRAIKSKGLKRTKKSLVYLGCSIEFLKEHLESNFLEGMNWENHGEWHIDHIVPLSTAKTEEDVYKLNHYTNLQPLWGLDNQRKSNKLF